MRQLIIGNKNLSSWSLRPWLVLTHFNIPFEEKLIRLDEPETRATIKEASPSGLVPCLVDRDQVIWDSLAICEYLAERAPDQALWPRDPAARALARCMVSEMHSGFSTLRTVWPMDVMTVGASVTCPLGVRKDLKRIAHLWDQAREAYGQSGPYLFGDFTIADAFFAPVVWRINAYGPVDLGEVAASYSETMLAHPGMIAWRQGAEEEATKGWYE